MKCKNFFCHNFDKDEPYNCAIQSLQAFKKGEYGVKDCLQRKAFERLKNRTDRTHALYTDKGFAKVSDYLDEIKSELEGHTQD